MSGVCMARATWGISFLSYCILHTGKVTHSGPFSKHGKLLGFCPRSVRGRHGLSAVRVPEDSRHTAIFPQSPQDRSGDWYQSSVSRAVLL